MADQPGIVSTDVAVQLLMLAGAHDLTKLSRAGWFKAVAPGQWRLVELIQGHIRYLQSRSDILPTAAMAALLGVSTQWLARLEQTGYAARQGANAWPRDDTVRGYIRFLREDARRSSKSAADSRVRDARANEIELRVAERAHTLIEREEAETAMAAVVGMVRTEFGGLPARVSRDLGTRHLIETGINDSLNRVASRLRAEAASLRSRGRAVDTNAANIAGRMGGDEPGISAGQ